MAKKKAAVQDEAEPANSDSVAELAAEEPGGEPAAPVEAPKVWTMKELMAEYFPAAKSVSGGVLAGLQRELRRRNRNNEKGY
jgi:hypothetical protein